ncbi:MAG: hypothetical protein V1775_00435 [Bacteroidota bacterium]
MKEKDKIEKDLIDGIQLIESKMRYPIEKISDAKSKIPLEMHLDLKSDYELKKLELMKLFIDLTANNSVETREKYEEILKGIKR